ncbi:tetratricopeptide repeat protein [Ferrimonas sp.]|uniref:tetratricopeptide repeat protein n=1 Tax=Ferrimonas sp. TaxID=2080861 RepID=UPI003A92BE71
MPAPLRITLWLLLILNCPLATADDLTQRLDELTLEVQLSTPGAYAKLDRLGARVLTATPQQQMRWHVLRCEAAISNQSLSEAQQAINSGLAAAEKLKKPQLIAYMNACEANNLMMLGKYDRALETINKAIHGAGAGHAMGLSLMRRADIYADQGDLEAALDDLHQALTWMESTHDKMPIYQPHPALISYSLARTYYYLGDYLRSDTLFEQAIQQAPQGSTLSWIIQVNHTFTLMQQERYQDASVRMEQLEKLVPTMDELAQARFNLLFSKLSLKLERYSDAYSYASLALGMFSDLAMEERKARARSFLAEAAFQLGKFEEANYQLKLARQRFTLEQDARVLTELDWIESQGEALQGNYQRAYELQLKYHSAYAEQQENLRKEALLQQKVQLDQKIDRNRAQLATQSSSYFKLHNQLMVWQVVASLSLLLWLIWLLFRLTSSRKVTESVQDYEHLDWRIRLERALSSTDRTLPVVKFSWEGNGLTDTLRKRIRNKDIRINDLMIECGERQLLVLLVDASEAEAERLRYRLSRNLAEAGYRNIATGVARTHPLDQADSLLARLECNQIQHSLMLSENVIRPDKPQWRR